MIDKKRVLPIQLIAIALFIFFFSIYLCFPCRVYFFDAIIYSAIAEGSEPDYQKYFFDPNHFIYNYLGYLFYQFTHIVGSTRDGYATLQLMNSLFGAFGISIFLLWLWKITKDVFVSWIGASLLGFAYGYWWRSSDALMYTSSVFFLLLCFIFVYRYSQEKRSRDLLLLGIFTSLSILCHQSNVFFLVVSTFAILCEKGGLSFKQRLKHYGVYLLILFFNVGIPYILVMLLQDKVCDIKTAWRWVLNVAASYSEDRYVSPYWSFHLKNIFVSFKTILNAIWYEGYANYLSSEISIIGLKILSLFSKFIFLLFLFYTVIIKKIWRSHSLICKSSLLFICAYALFFTWWYPGNIDYWISLLIPLFTLFSLGLKELFCSSKMYPRAVKGVVILLLVFMFTINFFGGIYPRSQVKNNPDMEVVNFIKRYVNKGVIVLAGMGDWYAGKVYIPHFVKVPRLSFDLFISKYGRKEGLEKFERKIYYWALYNGHVYLLSGLLDSKKVHEQIYKYLKIKKGDIERIFEPYEKKLIASYDKRDIKIYRLLPQKGWPVYHNMVGYDFMMKRKYEKAIYNFEKGLDSKFDFDVDVLISLGKCYLIIGKPERTIKLWEKAFTLFPNYSQELKRILEELKTKHEK